MSITVSPVRQIGAGIFGEFGKRENGPLGEEITTIRLHDSNIIRGKPEGWKTLHRLPRVKNSMRQTVLL